MDTYKRRQAFNHVLLTKKSKPKILTPKTSLDIIRYTLFIIGKTVIKSSQARERNGTCLQHIHNATFPEILRHILIMFSLTENA